MRAMLQRKEVEAQTFRRVLVTLILMVFLIIIGSLVKLGESENYKEALYKSVSLVTHLDLAAQSQGFFSFILYFLGGILGLFILITLISLIFEGRLTQDILEERRMKKIQSLSNHIIICGGGRVGTNVALTLQNQKIPFVILDENPESIAKAKKREWLALEEDSLDKDALKAAGIEHARAVVSCLDSDGDNILQVITTRELNAQVPIIARADYERSVEKLKNVGANEVILPTHIGGQMIAKMAMKTFTGA